VGNRPGFGHDRFALWRELWLAGRPAIEQRMTELRLQSVENVREAIRPEAGQGPFDIPPIELQMQWHKYRDQNPALA